MKDLGAVLAAFSDATHCGAVVWSQAQPGGALRAEFGRPAGGPPTLADLMPASDAPIVVHTEGRTYLVAAVPGPRRAWLALGPSDDGTPPRKLLDFLLPVVAHYLQASLEVEHAANELAERYEEINLLYTMSEILGRTVTLEEAASTILREISETVGARRGAILVRDPATDSLHPVAVLGGPMDGATPIPVGHPADLAARVFRNRHSVIAESGDLAAPVESAWRRGAALSVPIMWTSPDGPEPLGVVILSDRRSGQPFTAGDQKLVEAIATQIGTAIQNSRLVRASLTQQQLAQEMQLAHDLQMKLLPSPGVVVPEADAAARVIPAESVGGDFYHLFRLGGGRTGVMIGDVSSHGYRAALIMALAMSASAIHAQDAAGAAEALGALQHSLRDELESTEMFISLFYAIVDRAAGELHYANAGHPHAFVVRADGDVDRLVALNPPLGMTDDPPRGTVCPWDAARDLLLLFTDGISDARDRLDHRLGEQPVLDVVSAARAEPPAVILERVIALLDEHTGDVPRRDDVTLVILRT